MNTSPNEYLDLRSLFCNKELGHFYRFNPVSIYVYLNLKRDS